MPPPGSKQPEQREIDSFVAWMEAQLDAGGRARRRSRGTSRCSA